MIRNTPDQKWTVIAVDSTTWLPVNGIAATITAKIRKDGGTLLDTNDVNPEPAEDGQYDFDITQAESNAYKLNFYPESSTPGIKVFALPAVIYTTDDGSTPAPSTPVEGSVPFGLDGPVVDVGINGTVPPPHKVLAGVVYGPDDLLIGTAPESNKSHVPELVRGDDYSSVSTQITTLVEDPGDLGSLASCSAVFAGYNAQHRTGWRVTGGTVEDVGAGVLRLRSSLLSADTIPCKPDCNYRWSHTLVDASGEIRTQKHGVTRLIDGYAVDRYTD